MTPSLLRGRAIVLSLIFFLLAMYLLTPLLTSFADGTAATLGSDLVRFLLIAALCHQLHQGRAWARWLMIAFMGLAGGVALTRGIGAVSLNSMGAVSLLFLATLYLLTAGLLLFSPDVRTFLAYRASHR